MASIVKREYRVKCVDAISSSKRRLRKLTCDGRATI